MAAALACTDAAVGNAASGESPGRAMSASSELTVEEVARMLGIKTRAVRYRIADVVLLQASPSR